jgi:glycosyltransferase involved in cell wall biosynthesis
MANVLLNGSASTAGGGITYLRNVLPRLGKFDDVSRFFALVPAESLSEYAVFANDRLVIEAAGVGSSLPGRLWWEQTGLRRYIKSRKIDVLVSLGNFALFASPVPQILFSRNDLYFSEHFPSDLKARGLYSSLISHRLKSRLARISIKHADINVTPTKAFADRIRSCDGLNEYRFEALHFGFDPDVFTANDEPLSDTLLAKLNLSEKCYRLLYVSHYNYFRNFETLIRALPIIKREMKEKAAKEVQLVLTAVIKRGAVSGGYDATLAADLIDRLNLRRDIAMLGYVPYDKLHKLYRLCDLFVCPSYSDSFCHPLLEAMASGLPVVTANLDVHREVCGDAALYFDFHDEEALAAQCIKALTDEHLFAALRAGGRERHRHFSWDEHVRALAALVERALSI